MPYSFILSQESITDCSTLLIYESSFSMIPPQFSKARARIQNVAIMEDIAPKKFPLLLSKAASQDALRARVSQHVAWLHEQGSEEDAEVTMRTLLLQDALQFDEDVDFIKLQRDSLSVSLLCNGEAYEHGATFALAFLVGYMITVQTQVFKDEERFCKRDLIERIELQKIEFKLLERQK